MVHLLLMNRSLSSSMLWEALSELSPSSAWLAKPANHELRLDERKPTAWPRAIALVGNCAIREHEADIIRRWHLDFQRILPASHAAQGNLHTQLCSGDRFCVKALVGIAVRISVDDLNVVRLVPGHHLVTGHPL